MPTGKNKDSRILIFISEDDPDDQFIFKTAFSELKMDIEAVFFFTNQDLIQHLLKISIYDEAAKPDLIIADLKPPFFDLKDITEIRTFKQFELIPLVIFTESFTGVSSDDALSLGANELFYKPDSLNTLKGILKKIIDQLVREKKTAPPET